MWDWLFSLLGNGDSNKGPNSSKAEQGRVQQMASQPAPDNTFNVGMNSQSAAPMTGQHNSSLSGQQLQQIFNWFSSNKPQQQQQSPTFTQNQPQMTGLQQAGTPQWQMWQ